MIKQEHKCVLDSCRKLQEEGFDVTYLPVQQNGIIDLKELEAAIRPDTSIVSVMIYNETHHKIRTCEFVQRVTLFNPDAEIFMERIFCTENGTPTHSKWIRNLLKSQNLIPKMRS